MLLKNPEIHQLSTYTFQRQLMQAIIIQLLEQVQEQLAKAELPEELLELVLQQQRALHIIPVEAQMHYGPQQRQP